MLLPHCLSTRIVRRVVLGKLLGCVLGGMAFVFLWVMDAALGGRFLAGLWVGYIFLGAMIGLAGMLTRHPLLGFRMGFAVRGGMLGLIFHLILVLVGYEVVQRFLKSSDWMVSWGFVSPWWMLVDGMLVGIFMDFVLTRLAGEGAE